MTVNPQSGAGTPLGRLSGFAGGASIRGLAFSPDGVLYAINAATREPSGAALYMIDPDSLKSIRIGSTGFSTIQGLAFSPNGSLYGYDIYKGLLTIDRKTGLATDISPTTPGLTAIQTIAFDTNGGLYGGGRGLGPNGLFRIDPVKGTAALIPGSCIGDIRGLEQLPEPSAALLLLAVAIFPLARRPKQEGLDTPLAADVDSVPVAVGCTWALAAARPRRPGGRRAGATALIRTESKSALERLPGMRQAAEG
ncbi:MAG: hypothetical protein AMXMBFR13_45180 [Phycisphaerae bacterium]